MGESWEEDAIEAKLNLALRSNKWEGEDEEEEVKESWEDLESEEEKKDVDKTADVPKAKPKPKKKVAEKIEEREKKAREEAERKAKEKEEAMTPEERRAEQLRRQKLAEEADLRLAMETFGVTGIDTMMPDTAEEFEQFTEALVHKINQFNKHIEYPAFAEELINRIAVNLPLSSLKKMSISVNNLAIEKQKLEKRDKTKKNKGKGKATLKLDGKVPNLAEYDSYAYDDFNSEYDKSRVEYNKFSNEYDDFM